MTTDESIVDNLQTGDLLYVVRDGARRKIELTDFQRTFDVKLYGATGDGSTDDTAAIQAAMTAAYNAGGGTVYFPRSLNPYRINGQLIPANDGATPYKQRFVRLTGEGASNSGIGTAPYGGTQLDMRYAGAGVAKIDTRGFGLLEVDHLTLMDNGAGSVPFIQTTNTTLRVHNCEFYGHKTGVSCDQDAIVLGGTDTADGGSNAANAAFQGYGTVIEKNYFSHIRRGVYGRTYCNGVVVRDNTWWSTCGGSSAIEFLGYSGSVDSGGLITGNLIEVYYYTYPIKLDYCYNFLLLGNMFYDYLSATTADVLLTENTGWNTIFAGYDAAPALEDHGAENTFISNASGTSTHFGRPLRDLNVKNTVSGSPTTAWITETVDQSNTPVFSIKNAATNDLFSFLHQANGVCFLSAYSGDRSVQWRVSLVNGTWAQMGTATNHELDIIQNGTARIKVPTSGNVLIQGALGVGNSAPATTPGAVVKKIEIFDASGTSLGFVPVYNTIT